MKPKRKRPNLLPNVLRLKLPRNVKGNSSSRLTALGMKIRPMMMKDPLISLPSTAHLHRARYSDQPLRHLRRHLRLRHHQFLSLPNPRSRSRNQSQYPLPARRQAVERFRRNPRTLTSAISASKLTRSHLLNLHQHLQFLKHRSRLQKSSQPIPSIVLHSSKIVPSPPSPPLSQLVTRSVNHVFVRRKMSGPELSPMPILPMTKMTDLAGGVPSSWRASSSEQWLLHAR